MDEFFILSLFLDLHLRALRRAVRVLQVFVFREEQVQTPRRVAQADLQKMWRDISKRDCSDLSRKDPPSKLRPLHVSFIFLKSH